MAQSELFAELVELLRRHDDKLLVCRRRRNKCKAFGKQGVADFERLACALAADFRIEVVLHDGAELYAEQTAFSHNRATLFSNGAEVRLESSVGDNNCFTEEQAAFCAADVENVAVCCEVGCAHIVVRCAEHIAEACAVDEKIEAAVLAGLV